jgi:hypothetical protein
MGNAQSYTRTKDGYYAMRKACLLSESGSCVPVSIGSAQDKGNEFYKVRNPAPRSSTLASTVLHTANGRTLFYGRNAFGQGEAGRAAVRDALVKPLAYLAEHPEADLTDDDTRHAIATTDPPPGFCLHVQPCDALMAGVCCQQPPSVEAATENNGKDGGFRPPMCQRPNSVPTYWVRVLEQHGYVISGVTAVLCLWLVLAALLPPGS